MYMKTANLWRWQASSSLGANGQHGELLGCAAPTVWRWSEGIPLRAGQHVYQHRVDQGHLPLSGDVVTREISISVVKKSDAIKGKKPKRLKSMKVAHSRGSSNMQRVPKPGLSNNTSAKYLI